VTKALALPVLLSRVLGGCTAELESTDDAGDVSSIAVWSNVLRGVGDGRSERDLATETRISTRLAVAAVTGAARRGWVEAAPGKRVRDVNLTDAGRRSCEVWSERLAAHDERWAGSPLRTSLEALVAQLPLELPHFPATYGTADPSAVGGSFVAPRPGDGIPGHGQDWRPVLRGEGDTVSAVPLTGLLSQALVAFSIDYEARPMWPLASTTLVVRHLTAKPMPLADAPADHGITGNGKSLLERHNIAVVTKDPDNAKRKLVQLTELGERIRSHHDQFVADCETAWRERYGERVVADVRSALEARPSAANASLPDHVVAPLHLG
jgi:DNA-binding MarR family transcriptional regulator